MQQFAKPQTIKTPRSVGFLAGNDLNYAINLVTTICALAGSPSYVADLRTSAHEEGLDRAVRTHDTASLFDWFVSKASFQGISDNVAASYMKQHGLAHWHSIAAGLDRGPPCPKLKTYWHFNGCGYQKGSMTCSAPGHIYKCPLPAIPLRNGSLNRLAFSLFLFMRDVAGSDFIGWIDSQMANADRASDPNRLFAMGESLMGPLRNVHGLSDKVLNMSLATLLLGAGRHKKRWAETGASLIAVDSLVHNFLSRTGILSRSHAHHPYGPQCHGSGGCAQILRAISSQIDARRFNDGFPSDFPRFVQSAIWRYCAADGWDVCNGNNIDDTKACENTACRIFEFCDRHRLNNAVKALHSQAVIER